MPAFRDTRIQRKTRRQSATQKRLALEHLEHRRVLSAVNWIGPASGSWDVASNWSTGAVPQAGDHVSIDTAAALTITIQSGDSITIGSLSTGANDTLSITGGSLTVTAGTSTLSGPLDMSGGTLASSGSGAALTANGATSISSASLYAEGGGTLALPDLTSYSANGNTFEANGARSVLTLPALSSFSQTGGWTLNAASGGQLDLDSLKSLVSTGPGITINDTGGSTFADPVLTTLQGVHCSLDGTDQGMASAWTSFTHGSLSVASGTDTLPNLADIDQSSLYVSNGGRLALPDVTTYATNGTFEATGVGSSLDVSALASVTPLAAWHLMVFDGGEINLSGLNKLVAAPLANGANITISDYHNGRIVDPNLTTLSGVGFSGDGSDSQVADSWNSLTAGFLEVQYGSYDLPNLTDIDQSSMSVVNGGSLTLPAIDGYHTGPHSGGFGAYGSEGALNLPSLKTITGSGSFSISSNAGGTINVPSLKSITDTQGNGGVFNSIGIFESGGGRILDGELTTLYGVGFNSDGTDPQVANAWTSFTDGNLHFSGGSFDLTNLTSVDGSTLQASNGAVLSLPNIASFNAQPGGSFSVDGAGSQLNLPDLATVVTHGQWRISATNGGAMDIAALTALSGRDLYLTDSGGGSIIDSSLADLNGVNVSLDGTDPNVAVPWTSLTNGSLELTGGSLSVELTNIDGSSVSVQDASLICWGLANYSSDGTDFSAAGPGSLLDFLQLKTLTQQGSWTVSAAAGAEVKFDGLAQLNSTAGIRLLTVGSGSLLDLPALTSFTGTDASLTIGGGASADVDRTIVAMPQSGSDVIISVPSLPIAVPIDLGTTGELDGATFDIGEGDTVRIVGGTYKDGVTLNVPQGSTVDLTGGNLVSYSGTLTATGAGTVQLAAGGIAVAPGGLTLDFPAGTFQWSGGEFYESSEGVTNTGSLVVPAATALTARGDFTNSGILTLAPGAKLNVVGSFTQTSGGALNVQIDGTPESGQFGQLAVQSTAALDGSLNVSLGNGFVPQDNEDYRVITFAGASGSFAMVTGLGRNLHELVQPTSLDLVTSPHDAIVSPTGTAMAATESSVTWTGPSGGAWDVGSNWSTGTVPGADDDVMIDTSAPMTISISPGDNITVNSLTTGPNDTLAVSGGSLTVTGASTLSGPLTMSGGSLTAHGPNANLVVNGAASISAASLYADSGGAISLPTLTTYTSSGTTFESDGAGSVLDLPALASVSQSGKWTLIATLGGRLDLNALTSLVSTSGIQLTDTSGGSVNDPILSVLKGVTCSLDGSDQHIADAWASFTDGTLNFSQGTYVLPLLSNFDRSSVSVSSGGRLAFPVLVSYATNGSFDVTGAGTVLDVSALQNVTRQDFWRLSASGGAEIKLTGLSSLNVPAAENGTGIYISDYGYSQIIDPNLTMLNGVGFEGDGTDSQVTSSWKTFTNGGLYAEGGSYVLPNITDVDGSALDADVGGTLSLPGVTSYTGGNSLTLFDASGAGAVLDLSALKSMNAPGPMSINCSNGATMNFASLASLACSRGEIQIGEYGDCKILDGSLTTLDGVQINGLSASDPQFASSWKSFTNGQLKVNSGSFDLPQLTDVDNSQLQVSQGATLTLPNVHSINIYGGFSADGAGSVLDLPALTSVFSGASWGISASEGGTIKLPLLATLNGVAPYFTDTGRSTIADSDVTSLNGSIIYLDGTDTQVASSWTSFTNGRISLSDGSYSFARLTDLDGTTLYLQNGDMTFPALASYKANGSQFQVAGSATSIDFPALATLTLSGSFNLNVSSGADVKFDALTSISGADKANFSANGSGAMIELPDLASVADPAANFTIGSGASLLLAGNTLTMPAAGNAATITIPPLPFAALVTLTTTDAFTGGTTFNIGQGDTVNVAGGTYAGGARFNVSQGSTVDLTGGNLVDYSGMLTANGLGTVQLTCGGLIVVRGGLTLDFPVGTFQWTGGEIYEPSGGVTNTGSLVVPAATSLTARGDFTNGGSLTLAPEAKLNLGGSFTQTSGGTLNVQIDGTPQSDQFGRLAVQNAAALDGTLNVSLGNGFVPHDNEDYGVMTFGSANGAFATVTGLGGDLQERAQPTSLDLVTSLHDTIDSPRGTTIVAAESTTFNGTVASFTDANPLAQPGDFSANIDWGDGNTTAGSLSAASGGGFQVTGSHAYAEDGTETMTVSIANVSGVSATVQSQAIVAEAPTLGNGATLTAGQTTGLSDAVVATFTHGNNAEPPADFTATIDWGDGQTSAGTVLGSNGAYSILGSHTYAKSGTFSVQATVLDEGTTALIESSAVVLSVDAENANYVAAVYHDVLGRAPDAAGLAYWTDLLDSGTAAGSVAMAIAHSGEYYANFVIKPDYIELLGRAANEIDLSYWTAKMEAGLTDQQLEAEFISSAEFFQTAGGTNADWIQAVYKELLGRAASADDVSYWVQQLAGGATLASVAQEIANSQENNSQLIKNDYFHYLGRQADDAGLAYWLGQFAAGETNEDVIAGFTGSAEYYQDHSS